MVSGSGALPTRMLRLPLDRHGRPVPWFVHFDDEGKPDFRVVGRGKVADARRFDLCWVCGARRGRHAAFVLGPMCGVNRVSAEPPSHLDCAVYAARMCPFLATPHMTRRASGLPDLNTNTPGGALTRNPGVALVWSSKTWAPFRVPDEFGPTAAGVMWDIGDPTAVRWYARGGPATRDQVQASLDRGLPELQRVCLLDRDPEASRAHLARQVEQLLPLLPAADARRADQ